MITWADLTLPPINLWNVWHLQAKIEERNDKWRENYLRHRHILYVNNTLSNLYSKRMTG